MENTQDEMLLIYTVVVNLEEQYSIWPAERETPIGWRAVDVTGSKEQCLAHIKKVWTDMRPLSLRKHMDDASEESKTD